jgi:hypothetical protein
MAKEETLKVAKENGKITITFDHNNGNKFVATVEKADVVGLGDIYIANHSDREYSTFHNTAADALQNVCNYIRNNYGIAVRF